MKKLNLILLCILIASCATQQYKPVNIPVPMMCPAPIVEPTPDYAIRHLTPADAADSAKVHGAYIVTTKQCTTALTACQMEQRGRRHD